MAADDDDLTRAVAVWTGHGTRTWPGRDDAAVVREFGKVRGLALLAEVRALEEDFYSSDAYRTERDLQAMTARASEQFRSQHPSATPALVQAFAWCYSWDHK